MTTEQLIPRVRRWLRFVLGGGINTVITYSIYLFFLFFLGYQWAYLIAYVCGIVFSYWFNSLFVFKASISWRGLAAYPLVYLVQYGMSALLLGILVEWKILGEKLAPLFVVALTVPLTYVISKLVIQKTSA